jgi:hypothetical protein
MKEKKIQSKVLSGVIQFKIINHGFLRDSFSAVDQMK